MKHTTPILALILAAGLLSLAAPGHALYIETPLNLISDDHTEVGDDFDLQIQPNPNTESAKQDWAGKTVQLYYSFDPNESNDPDHPVSSEDRVEHLLDTITLDDGAKATYTWTVPAEVDDRNIGLRVQYEADDHVAFTHVAVGNATPMMQILASGPSDGASEIDPEQATGEDSAEAAGAGLVALVGALGAAALGLARVRRS